MKIPETRPLLLFVFLLASSGALCPQEPQGPLRREKDEDVKLPDGRKQRDAILKADHERNIQDARRLAVIAGELQADMEKNTQFVFSLDDLKKTDEIEKLVKHIRGRMKRY